MHIITTIGEQSEPHERGLTGPQRPKKSGAHDPYMLVHKEQLPIHSTMSWRFYERESGIEQYKYPRHSCFTFLNHRLLHLIPEYLEKPNSHPTTCASSPPLHSLRLLPLWPQADGVSPFSTRVAVPLVATHHTALVLSRHVKISTPRKPGPPAKQMEPPSGISNCAKRTTAAVFVFLWKVTPIAKTARTCSTTDRRQTDTGILGR